MTIFNIFLLIMYFVPTIVGSMRHHHNEGAILALNLLLGWTLIGWVVALVWALTETHDSRPRRRSTLRDAYLRGARDRGEDQ